MPRKRTIPDEALLDAALLVVRGDGPDALTFSALSARTGLAPSTLVQRFGSKPELLRAALQLAWDRLDEATARAAEVAAGGPEGVVDLLVELTGQYDAERYADQLLLLREDLRDPVLRARGQVWLATLADAVDERLDGTPGADGLGILVVAHWQGVLTVWGFTRDGPPGPAVRRSLEALLARLTAGRRAHE